MIKLISQAASAEFLADPLIWLARKAAEHDLKTMLAFAENGVLWGRVESGTLRLASSAFPEYQRSFNLAHLHELRLFGEQAELHLWKNSDSTFKFRIFEEGNFNGETMEQTYLLWGNGLAQPDPKDGFTLMAEGRQNFYHVPPLADGAGTHAGLRIRHYFEQDDDGQARICFSRLVKLEFSEKEYGNG